MDALLTRTIGTFGQTVNYIPNESLGAGFPITGVLDAGIRAEGEFPETFASLFCRLGDFPAPPQRQDRLEVGAASPVTTYIVTDVQADSEGGVRLTLQKLTVL